MTFTDLLEMPLPPRLALPNKFWEVIPDCTHPAPSAPVPPLVAETPIRLRTVRPGNPLSFRSGPVTPAEKRNTPRRASQTVVPSRVVSTPGTPSPVDDLSF